MGNQQVVDLMEHVWHSIYSLCTNLNEAQGKKPPPIVLDGQCKTKYRIW
ncbi:MAG: hypothetical protein Ct9H300mP11_13850 [Chloroflexota bacterium]|nr:MAG: hypothetical protein Ct9H300mP11_13850 [Chloroflexota bacterium]